MLLDYFWLYGGLCLSPVSHTPSGWGICIHYSLHLRANFGSLPVKSHLMLNYALHVEKGGIPQRD